jgi:N-acetylmuramoyl-L-alanine amidase
MKQARFYVLRNNIENSILVECEFIDEMAEWLNSENVKLAYAYTIGEALVRYFGVESKDTKDDWLKGIVL